MCLLFLSFVYVASIYLTLIVPQVRIAAIVLIVPSTFAFPQVIVALLLIVDLMQAFVLFHLLLERASTPFLDFCFRVSEARLLVNRLISNLFRVRSCDNDLFFKSAIIGLVCGVSAHLAQLVS